MDANDIGAVAKIDERIEFVTNQRALAEEDMMAQVKHELSKYDIALQELLSVRALLVGEDYDEPIDYGTHDIVQRVVKDVAQKMPSRRPTAKRRDVVLSPKSGTPVPTSVQSLRDKMVGG